MVENDIRLGHVNSIMSPNLLQCPSTAGDMGEIGDSGGKLFSSHFNLETLTLNIILL
jgi:hypothetical protein